MHRVPTTEASANADAGAPVVVDAGPAEFDPVLGVYTLFFDIPRAETSYMRLVVESWEDFGVPRTLERFTPADASRSLVVVMTVPDFVEPASRGLARLCREIGARQVPSRPELRESLRRDLLETA